MKKLIILLLFQLGLQGNILAQQTDSIQKLPTLQLARVPKIDVKHIILTIHFDWKKKQAFGTSTITFSPLSATNRITLDAGMLTINSVTSKGKTLQFNYDGGDKNDGLEIILDKTYAINEKITISIDYHTNYINQSDPNSIGGSFGKGLRFFEPTFTTPIKRKQIWSIGEAEINRYWFPSYDAPNDFRTTEFIATVDKNLTVISNGKLIDIKNNTNGTKTFHYKTNQSYQNFLTSFVIGEYIDIQQQVKGIKLHTFAYPDEKIAAEATIERLPDMVNYFNKITGAKFPFPSYSQVMVQDYPFPGLTGTHGFSTISDNMIDDFKTHADFLYLWDGIEADALASQWFGNHITTKDWSHVWLSKSFARYLDGLYTDYKNGHDEYLMWYHPYDTFLTFADWNNGNRHPIVTQNYDNIENFVGDNYARYRGSLVLRLLRLELGDEIWFKTIQYYVKTNANKSVTTTDFQKAVETISKRKMDWFFDQWIYKIGHPQFDITKEYNLEKKLLTLYIKQIQKIDENNQYPQAQFFKGKMKIEIDDTIVDIQIEHKAENSFTFNVLKEPKLINVDFENNWIREIQFDKSFSELLYQIQNSKDVLARKSSINELVGIYKKNTTSVEDKSKIKQTFRDVIQSNCYWRLKASVLTGLMNLYLADSGNNPIQYDELTTKMLLNLIENGEPWVRVSAVTLLGQTNDPSFTDIYINKLNDSSERVVAVAAIALGKTKSPKAFDVLVNLKDKPSWKNQSLMSALNGLKELGDPRGADIALNAIHDNNSPRWFLGNGWDYPFVAAQTLYSLGKTEEAYPILLEQFKKSLEEDDINDVFSNVLLITTIADPRSQEVFDVLKEKFKDNANAMIAINQYEQQFKDAIKK
jgi:aminopeptidase N